MRCMFADIFTCFAGELPKELGKLASLTVLYLSNNKFQGEFVCSSIHVLCLVELHLRVAGELPKELGNLVNLKVLWMQHNGFTGTIVCPRHTCAFRPRA